jgi:predicted nucleic acid-binding protein
MMSDSEVFLDTAFAIALSAPSDEHHESAVLLAQELEANQTRLITTRAVLLEIGNALSSSVTARRRLNYYWRSKLMKRWRSFRCPKNCTNALGGSFAHDLIKNGASPTAFRS